MPPNAVSSPNGPDLNCEWILTLIMSFIEARQLNPKTRDNLSTRLPIPYEAEWARHFGNHCKARCDLYYIHFNCMTISAFKVTIYTFMMLIVVS